MQTSGRLRASYRGLAVCAVLMRQPYLSQPRHGYRPAVEPAVPGRRRTAQLLHPVPSRARRLPVTRCQVHLQSPTEGCSISSGTPNRDPGDSERGMATALTATAAAAAAAAAAATAATVAAAAARRVRVRAIADLAGHARARPGGCALAVLGTIRSHMQTRNKLSEKKTEKGNHTRHWELAQGGERNCHRDKHGGRSTK